MITAKNITHNYAQDIALKDVSLNINSGEFTSFIGESGSGKSTLLSILSTLLKPSLGEIILCGEKIDEIPNIDQFRREHIGFIFQFHYLINYLSIEENIMLATDTQNKRYIKELLSYLQIEDIKKKYPNEISGGQRQRAAIARAIANQPKIIFADEPTGNLDSKNSLKVFNLLKEISQKGTTVVVATHDTKLAQLADTIYEVTDGNISKYS